MKTYKQFLLGIFLMIWSYRTTADPGGPYREITRLVSPGKKINVEIALNAGTEPDDAASGQLFYRVNYREGNKERSVLPYSTLGISTNSGSFTDHLTVSGLSSVTPVHDRYKMLTGKRALCVNEGVAQTLHLKNEKGERLDIVFRLYDNGVCFRYVLPGSKDSVTITDEATGFTIPHKYQRWMQEYRPEYEDFYTDSSLYKQSFWGFPALFQVSGTPIYMLISEANITRDNCGSRLSNEAKGDVFKVSLPAPFHEFGKTAPSGRFPYNTPWRVLIIGTLASVFESTLITDVSKPAVEQNTSWIQSGPAAWVYWANNHGSKDFRIVKEYIDLAVAMHWPYVLIDWEWDQMTNGGTVEDAVSYAKTKGIKSLLWYNSGTAWLGATPVDRLLTHEKRVKEFSWLQKIGVKGIKVDFFAGDQQAMMSYYIDILEDAARYQLLVNFHGATVPRGWSRTYPNLVSTEAVYGAEQYNNGAALTPLASRHNTILPFTRNVIGPMDYTPVTFTDSQHPHITSYAHELALSVVFESGIQHFADRPSGYYELPEQPKEFLMGIPTAWDDSKLIDGEPGEKAVVARRKGAKWYIGGLNGSGQEKEMTLHFPFLGPGQHTLSLILDGGDAKSFSIKTISVNKISAVKVHCLGMGGFAGIIR
jgi:hypothetical protein